MYIYVIYHHIFILVSWIHIYNILIFIIFHIYLQKLSDLHGHIQIYMDIRKCSSYSSHVKALFLYRYIRKACILKDMSWDLSRRCHLTSRSNVRCPCSPCAGPGRASRRGAQGRRQLSWPRGLPLAAQRERGTWVCHGRL